jgi:hypothetical protein
LFPAGLNNGVHCGLHKNPNFRLSILPDFLILSTQGRVKSPKRPIFAGLKKMGRIENSSSR